MSNPVSNQHSNGQGQPWYRQFWPWFIIALPASAVVAGLLALWIAISNPDYLVIDDEEYSRLNSSLKAEPPPAKPGPNND